MSLLRQWVFNFLNYKDIPGKYLKMLKQNASIQIWIKFQLNLIKFKYPYNPEFNWYHPVYQVDTLPFELFCQNLTSFIIKLFSEVWLS